MITSHCDKKGFFQSFKLMIQKICLLRTDLSLFKWIKIVDADNIKVFNTDRLTPIPISIVCKTISKLNWNQMWILSNLKINVGELWFVFSENKYHEMLPNKLIKLPVINPDAFLSWMFCLHWLPDVLWRMITLMGQMTRAIID